MYKYNRLDLSSKYERINLYLNYKKLCGKNKHKMYQKQKKLWFMIG